RSSCSVAEPPIAAEGTLTALVCSVDAGGLGSTVISTSGASVSIKLAEGDGVTCTYTNTQQAHIIVKKVTQPSGDSQSFAFSLSGGAITTQSFSLTDQQTHDSGAVAPSVAYAASETVPAGWTQTSATCDNGNAVTAITPNA